MAEGKTGEGKASAAARLQKELMELMRNNARGKNTDGITAFPVNNDLFQWTATVRGVSNTPYEGLEFKLSLRFPDNYPFAAPTVSFVTPCFHPNVDAAHGIICLDILKEKWSAAYSVLSVLLSVQSLLDCPNNQSPLNVQAAQLWGQSEPYRRAVLAMYDRAA